MAQTGPGIELLLERVPLGRIHVYERNAREHSEEQLATLMASIRANGFAFPVVLTRQGSLIAGHARLEAARRLGLEDVPAIRVHSITEEQARSLRLADNRIAELATWNEELLARELLELKQLNIDLDAIGFDEAELAVMFKSLGDPEPDPIDEPTEEQGVAIAKPGDLWLLGTHRLVCGDAGDEGAVSLATAGEVPALMVTDPPYGVDYTPAWRNESTNSREAFGASVVETVLGDSNSDWSAAFKLFAGPVAYVWHAALNSIAFARALELARFELRAQIIWRKQQPMVSRGHYHWQHEPCWYAVRKGATANWTGDRKQSTVWDVNSYSGFVAGEGIDERQAHGTQKPAELMLRAIANHTGEGALVYDPFVGSGTTIVACEQSGRRCAAIDLDPRCVDVALRRWRKFAGKEPTLAGIALAELEQVRGG